MSIEVFGDATASHKSAEGRSKHYEWSQLIVVEKREAVKRECACRGAIRLPDEQSEERALDLFYSTKTYRQLSDPKYGLQLMSDGYIVENVLLELRNG